MTRPKTPAEKTPEKLIDELGVAILGRLPEAGAKLGKYLPDARTSGRLKKELDDPYVTAAAVGRRLSELKRFGFAVPAGPHTSKDGWQRTEAGKQFFDRVSGDGK